jgi:Ser/Thr protein kinase RdoA (MazF antagonist)
VDWLRTVTQEQALQIARLWNPAASQVAHLRSGEHSTWATELDSRRSILRLTNEEHRTRDQIEAELDFIEHLAAGGLAVARPLTSWMGERVVQLPRSARTGGCSWAAMFERLEGRHYEYHSSDIDRPLFRLWGETMGRMHNLSLRFEPIGNRRRPDWCDDAVAGCSTRGVALEEELLARRDEIVRWLSQNGPDATQYGMVHGDFERSNFLLHNGSINLFDFDDSCRHWFAWDVACALWVFRRATAVERPRFLGWFLEGYSRVREPDTGLLRNFTELVRLRSVALLMYRLRNMERFAGERDHRWAEETRTWLRSPWSW